MARKIRGWKFWCHWYDKMYFFDSHHIHSRSCGNHFPVCSIKCTLGKIILFLKAAKNILVKNRSRIGDGNVTEDSRSAFTSSQIVPRNWEVASNGGGEEGELRMTQTRVARKWPPGHTFGRLVKRVRDKNSSEKLQPYARIRKTGSHNAETGVRWPLVYPEGLPTARVA